jgi:hypothetical protein
MVNDNLNSGHFGYTRLIHPGTDQTITKEKK